MASNSGKKVVENMENLQAFGHESLEERSGPKEEKRDVEFDCPIVDGVLAPIPLSMVPMDPATSIADFQLHLGSSEQKTRKRERSTTSSVEEIAEQLQQGSSHAQSSTSADTTHDQSSTYLFFKLFKFSQAGEQYILEKYEVETGEMIGRWHLILEQKNSGKKLWDVGIYDLEEGSHIVLPIVEDPIPPLFHKKFNYSLQERLKGWRLDKRMRPNNSKGDKFYYHQNRQFRSFIEVASYILYASKPNDLRPFNPMIPPL